MAKQPDLVLIEWVDSGQPVPGWQWLSELKAGTPHRCISVGFLVQDDTQTKVIAPNLAASEGDKDWDQASGLMTIPTAAVVKIVRLLTSSATVVPYDRDAA